MNNETMHTTETRRMKQLSDALKNDLRGVNIEEDEDLLGFLLTDPNSGGSLFSVYCAPSGFSAYSAIDDVMKGVRCEDEKPLLLNASLGAVISAIKHEQVRLGLIPSTTAANYFGAPSPSEGVLMQWKGGIAA